MMTKRSMFLFGACALAATALRRRSGDLQKRAAREAARCEDLLRSLDARCSKVGPPRSGAR